jgi:hypothetical protein
MNRRTWLFLSSAVALTASIACILNPQPLPPDTNDGSTAGGAGGHQNGTTGTGGTGGSTGSSGGGGDAGEAFTDSGGDSLASPLSPDGATDAKGRDGAGTDGHSEASSDAPGDVRESEAGDGTTTDGAKGDALTPIPDASGQ